MRRIPLLIFSIGLLTMLTGCGGGTSGLPALGQSVTSSDGVTVRVPDGWLEPVTRSGVILYNNADGKAGMDVLQARSGGLAIQISRQTATSDQTPADLFDSVFNRLASRLGMTLSAKETVSLGGVDVIKSSGAMAGTSPDMALTVALKPVSEGYVTVIGYLHPDELAVHTPVIDAIIASIGG